MTVLAVGGTGQVGSLVVERLVADGLEVRALTRDPAKAKLPKGATAVKATSSTPTPCARLSTARRRCSCSTRCRPTN